MDERIRKEGSWSRKAFPKEEERRVLGRESILKVFVFVTIE